MSDRNPKPWARFTTSDSTHEEVKKTPDQLARERVKREKLADIEEREFLKEIGLFD
jgi:hypothetical protein